MKKLKNVFTICLASLLIPVTTIAKDNPGIDRCVEACDKALKEADKVIDVQDIQLKNQEKLINTLETENMALQKSLEEEREVEFYENPFLTLSVGIVLGILAGGLAD